MKITIVGVGYVGLVTAICLASKGHNIICIDNNKEKIDMLKNCKSPIFEPRVEEYMHRFQNNLKYTSDIIEAYKNTDIIIICVGTPENEDGSVNLNLIYKVSEEISKSIEKNCFVVIKSTVPMGTNKEVEKFINKNVKNDICIETISNPEFLSQGTAIENTLNADRIVVGVKSKTAEKVMKEMYKDFNSKIIVTDRETSEMIKYAANNFLALKISYINEIANLCEKVGANVEDVSKGIGMDSRIGTSFLKAGIGYGGSCFPKDTKALNYIAKQNNIEMKTIRASMDVNENQKFKLIEKSRKYYKSFKNLNVAILGLSFKPNTDDARGSQAIENINLIVNEGANSIKIFDPIYPNNYFNKNQIQYIHNIEETLKDVDICLIFTEWDEIKQIDTNIFKNLMKNPIVLDGRNCFDLDKISEGIIYESIGRKNKHKFTI